MLPINQEIANALRHIGRNGNTAFNIFYEKKCNNRDKISPEEALKLYNSYGIPIRYLLFMIDSHGMEIDGLKEFENLIEEQEKQHKKSIQC